MITTWEPEPTSNLSSLLSLYSCCFLFCFFLTLLLSSLLFFFLFIFCLTSFPNAHSFPQPRAIFLFLPFQSSSYRKYLFIVYVLAF